MIQADVFRPKQEVMLKAAAIGETAEGEQLPVFGTLIISGRNPESPGLFQLVTAEAVPVGNDSVSKVEVSASPDDLIPLAVRARGI